MKRLQDRVAVVTGGASGIGAATVRRFVAEGARVVIADLDVERGQALASELDQLFQPCDVTDEAAVAATVALAIDRFGRIDAMVNNAGVVGVIGSLTETPADAWRRTLAILLDGVFFGMKHAALAMRASGGGGVILSTASVAGLRGGLGPHAYTAAKHAVVGLTRSAAAEFAPDGIRVNAVCPGKTVTPLVAGLRGGHAAAMTAAAEDSPLGSALMPDEVAAAFAWLASDEAAHVTGETVTIDSGKVATGRDRPALLSGPARWVSATAAD